MPSEVAIGVTDVSEADDTQLVARLIEAFLRGDESHCYSDDSQWTTIRRMQETVVAAVRARQVGAVQAALHRPHEGYLFYGFEDLGAWSVDAYQSAARRESYAAHCYDLVQRLARALGALAVPNPEAPDRTVAVPPLAALLDRIESALGIPISPPAPYGHYYGLSTDRGILGERVLNALYAAGRVRQLTQGLASPRVLEIGAGVGRLAHYCHRMGITDYWIVDVPMTSLVHGHFLGRAVGADRVVLDGEAGAHDRRDAIKILSPQRFFEDATLDFDLVVNIDSLTELGHEVAASYLRAVAARAPILLSVNHEVNPFTVCELQHQLGLFDAAGRHPYWMRAGYVEEVYTRRDCCNG